MMVVRSIIVMRFDGGDFGKTKKLLKSKKKRPGLIHDMLLAAPALPEALLPGRSSLADFILHQPHGWSMDLTTLTPVSVCWPSLRVQAMTSMILSWEQANWQTSLRHMVMD